MMKYSITFLLLAVVTSGIAMTHGHWWHALHWLSASFLLMSLGYAGLGHRIFAKQADGRVPLWSKLVHLPYMAFSGLLWHAIRLLSRENPVDQVTESLVVGRRLLQGEFPPNIRTCVDLTAEVDEPRQIVESTNYINLPVLDAGVPSEASLTTALSSVGDGITYVHCAQGHGRTALFAAALLVERMGIGSLDEAVAMLENARPGIRMNRTQRRFLQRYLGDAGVRE